MPPRSPRLEQSRRFIPFGKRFLPRHRIRRLLGRGRLALRRRDAIEILPRASSILPRAEAEALLECRAELPGFFEAAGIGYLAHGAIRAG